MMSISFTSTWIPTRHLPSGFEDVPLRVLLPAYILSELKTAFLMGFQIYLPFLIVDLGGRQRDDFDGDADAPASGCFLAVQTAVVRAGGRLALVVQMLMDSFGTVTLTEKEHGCSRCGGFVPNYVVSPP